VKKQENILILFQVQVPYKTQTISFKSGYQG